MVKLERILFCTFLFLIPFQIRDVWYWGGSEWNSVFLYLTDLLFILVLVFWIIRTISRKSRLQIEFLLIIFLIIAGLSLFFASNLTVGIYRWVKLIEFGLLFLYVRNVGDRASRRRLGLLHVLIAAGLLQSALAISQFLKQSSLGLGILEAGVFVPGAPGVATFIMENGEKVMRAYGSFPHPNVLAGFTLLTIFCVYKLLIGNPKSEARNPKQIQITKLPNIQKTILPICLFILIFGLFLTFSRVAIVTFLVISLIMFLLLVLRSPAAAGRRRVVSLFLVFAFSCLLSTIILFPHLQARFFTISFEEEAIDLRFFYNKMAFTMIKEKPFLGIGIGNFVWHSQNYPAFLRAGSKMLGLETVPDWIYQPVHNLYLLIAVEMGIVGLVVFGLFIISLLWRRLSLPREAQPLTFLVVGFLILGFTDHYFWTLHSGGLIFWLALALTKIN